MKKPYIREDGRFIGRYKESARPRNAVAEIPDSISFDDYEYLIWTGSEVIVDEVLKAQKEAEAQATEAITQLYNNLNKEVLADMAITFETNNPDSAITNYIMFIDMQANAAEYLDKGLKVTRVLKAEDGTTMFGPGDLLNTEEKVLQYAERRLQLAREYGIRRLQKIDKFVDDKNNILGV